MDTEFIYWKDMKSWLDWTRENLSRGCDLADLCCEIRAKGPKLSVLNADAPPFSSGLRAFGSDVPYDYRRSATIVPTLREETYAEAFAPVGTPDFQLFFGIDFLPVDLCRSLAEKIERSSRPSTLTTSERDQYFRTSSTCDLALLDDPEVHYVNTLISGSMGIPVEFSEPIQGQMYEPGQQFKPHTDYFNPDMPEFLEHATVRGQRTWTFMIYLEAPDEGGATYFPTLDLQVPCRVGTAVVWNNLKVDGDINPYSLHEGTQVSSGRKIIITKWFRDRIDRGKIRQHSI